MRILMALAVWALALVYAVSTRHVPLVQAVLHPDLYLGGPYGHSVLTLLAVAADRALVVIGAVLLVRGMVAPRRKPAPVVASQTVAPPPVVAPPFAVSTIED